MSSKPLPDVDADTELPGVDLETLEETGRDADVQAPILTAPALSPRSRPSSLGISFAATCSGKIELELCLTWARYLFLEGTRQWQRRPRYCILTMNLAKNDEKYYGPDGRETSEDNAEIMLTVLVRQPAADSETIVSVFLTNKLKNSSADRLSPEDCIFQPQIRINATGGTRITPGIEGEPAEEEEKTLKFLYQDMPIKARGHLCGAVWSEIDPEAEPEVTGGAREIPFTWPDGSQIPKPEYKRFSPPEIRTEYMPMFPVMSPEYEWVSTASRPDPVEASQLSESWTPNEIRLLLEPIADLYRDWIETIEESYGSDDSSSIGKKLMGECRTVLARIVSAIDMLCSDEDVRLSFCFANRVLDEQSQWARGTGLKWRPFQLGFILTSIESIANPQSSYRNTCDLLCAPTAAGKTEAYLALVAFTLGLRRRRAASKKEGYSELGTAVISRYTLRLLTIEQFRRMVAMVTACECRRVEGLGQSRPVGWRPEKYPGKEEFLWGVVPFSTGLWVGGSVTPNRLKTITVPDPRGGRKPLQGGIDALRDGPEEGDPAQLLECPACHGILAVPEAGTRERSFGLHLVLYFPDDNIPASIQTKGKYGEVEVAEDPRIERIEAGSSHGFATLSMELESEGRISAHDIVGLWNAIKPKLGSALLVPLSASRPGYFPRTWLRPRGGTDEYDFEIFCPNPRCGLHRPWVGATPSGSVHGRHPSIFNKKLGECVAVEIRDSFREASGGCDRIPILAYTVDDQIYMHGPSVLVATADKFARMAYEPRAAVMFGNATHHHCVLGYHRIFDNRDAQDDSGHPKPSYSPDGPNYVEVPLMRPPDLILQDELHLIEGPLGSMFGIYEAALEFLVKERGIPPKYIASTATVHRAAEHISSIFARKVQLFPPPGIRANDRFFVRDKPGAFFDDQAPGRLYVAICAPGKGSLTPVYRIWARLMQTAYDHRTDPQIDPYWTLTGYFNAIRELGGTRALYRQDIIDRIYKIASASHTNAREIPEDKAQELSSVTRSTDLPSVLELLKRKYPEAQDALFTTSMFGTGIDITRLGLMVVHGQPKTTSAYIQATGRVGRGRGALVVVFLRATRPRDLNHYEYFTGYHRQLQRFVEPVTVYPFAPGVIDRAGGPVVVSILRNMRGSSIPWQDETTALSMAGAMSTANEVKNLPKVLEDRSLGQPNGRKPTPGETESSIVRKIEAWHSVAANSRNLEYVEYAMSNVASKDVVLGDDQHQQNPNLQVVYKNAPQSLRDIEEATGFQTQ